MEKKTLYGLLTNPISDNPYPMIVQVSFNKAELEEIANYVNQFKYFGPRAEVIEVDEHVCQWYWPTSRR